MAGRLAAEVRLLPKVGLVRLEDLLLRYDFLRLKDLLLRLDLLRPEDLLMRLNFLKDFLLEMLFVWLLDVKWSSGLQRQYLYSSAGGLIAFRPKLNPCTNPATASNLPWQH